MFLCFLNEVSNSTNGWIMQMWHVPVAFKDYWSVLVSFSLSGKEDAHT